MTTIDYANILYFLNGPLLLLICLIGIFFNIIAIYVLCTAVFPSRVPSRSQLTNSHSLLKSIYEMDESVTKKNPTINIRMKKTQRSRISIYLLWLTGCDIALLICSIFNFSVPFFIDDSGNVYMKTISFW
jgi:hypothetical protein